MWLIKRKKILWFNLTLPTKSTLKQTDRFTTYKKPRAFFTPEVS